MSDTTAMTIAVEFEVRVENTSVEGWIETWGARAKDALEFEPKTTAYEAAVARDDPNRVLVFERYEGGDATLREHMNRPAHQELMARMQAERMTKRRPWIAMGYELEGFGWRFSNAADGGISRGGAVIEITAIHAPDRENVVDGLRLHADQTLEPGGGTLLYGRVRWTRTTAKIST